MATAIRRTAWREGDEAGWHEDFLWYAAAVHQMKLLTPDLDAFLDALADALANANPVTGQLPPARLADMAGIAAQWSNPLGLGYQSQVHGTFVARASWPTFADSPVLWRECAHNHWFFLPWHRAYLLEFEEIARSHISQLGGPAAEWALPYWNYSDFAADARRLGLPLPLRGDTLPDSVNVPGVEPRADGSFPNPLFNPVRRNQGDGAPGTNAWADATIALLRPHYANQQDTGRVSFGGGVIEEANNPAVFHNQSQELGQMDLRPHGSVHMRVHGAMSLFQTAAIDPVFWMHHANVDRMWETYARDLEHGYPFQDGVGVGTAAHQSWLTQRFRFLQPDGTVRSWTAPELLDVSQLGYQYDSTEPPPLPPPPAVPPPGSEIDPFGLDVGLPQPVAASEPFTLTDTIDVAVVGGGEADRDLPVAAFPATAQWLLRFDGIRSLAPPSTSYHVYLGLPSGSAAEPEDSAHYVGLLSLFGVYEASLDDGSSPGDGQRRVLDVTAQVQSQAATLLPLATQVRLVPLETDPSLGAVEVFVARVSLEFVGD